MAGSPSFVLQSSPGEQILTMLWLSVSVLALLAPTCYGSIVGGRRTYINYNSKCGVWNNQVTAWPRVGDGLVLEECCPVDATYPGNPWQQLSLSYVQGGMPPRVHFTGNTGLGGCPSYTVLSERVLDDGTGLVGVEHTYRMGLLTVTKTETWDFDGKTIRIRFRVKYTKESYLGNCKPIEKLSVMHAVDPDQDFQPFGTYSTFNDVIYNGGSGLLAEATGPASCKTLGYGICGTKQLDGSFDQVGFTRWTSQTPANLVDPGGALADDTMHYQHTEGRAMHCGDEREFGFFVVWGRCNDEARTNFLRAHPKFCEKCFKLPKLFDTKPPRCKGLCPCNTRHRKSNCTCNYKCPAGPVWTPIDVATDIREKERISEKCSGGSKTTAVDEEDPDMINVEAGGGDEATCAIASETLELGRRRR